MTRHLLTLIIGLVIISLSVFFYKLCILGFPLTPDSQTESWLVEAEVHYKLDSPDAPPPYDTSTNESGSTKGTNIRLNIPQKLQHHFIVENESFGTGGFGYYIIPKKSGHRQLVWSISPEKTTNAANIIDIESDTSITVFEPLLTPINGVLYYRAYVRPRNPNIISNETMPQPSRPRRHVFNNPAAGSSAKQIIANIRKNTAGDEAFSWGIIHHVLDQSNTNQDLKIISEDLSDQGANANDFSLIVLLLRESGYPARIAKGIWLREDGKGSGRDVSIPSWIEVYHDNHWNMYHPNASGFQDENAFALWYDEGQMLTIDGGSSHKVVISLQGHNENTVKLLRQETRSGMLSQTLQDFFYKFSLFSLPLRMQDVYKFLLVIPLGALMIIIFRNLIGMQTFGTFMPVLIALAFRETGLITGLSLLVTLMILGFSIRYYFSRFKLLLVPRLGSMLIVVLLLIVLLSLVLTRTGILGGLSVTLFPMVILTMVIERMSIMWEERGPVISITFTIGTLLASTIIFITLMNSIIEHIVFVFPELLLLCLAFSLLMGRYSGYRLMELFRFRSLTKEIDDVDAHK